MCSALCRDSASERALASAPLVEQPADQVVMAEIDRGHHHRVALRHRRIGLDQHGEHRPGRRAGRIPAARGRCRAASCGGRGRAPPGPERLIASIGVAPQRSFVAVEAPSASSRSIACGVRAKARIEPALGAIAGSPPSSSRPTSASSFISSASTRPMRAPRRISSARMSARSAREGEHQRRPMVIFRIAAVHVGAGGEEQVEHVAALRLDRDVERLRPAAPIRMRADRVGERRRGGERGADLARSRRRRPRGERPRRPRPPPPPPALRDAPSARASSKSRNRGRAPAGRRRASPADRRRAARGGSGLAVFFSHSRLATLRERGT